MRYDPNAIESKWQKHWLKNKIYEPNLTLRPARGKKRSKRPFYNLMMFPYPSAEGLHVGNMYAFTGSDIYGRFKRMRGYDVFEPIGLDGFGIHSENYALSIGRHPADQAKVSEKRFYRQLEMIGNGFAWDEHLETYDPDYYRWTQWIFIQMFKRGLAYRKKAAVNWCLSCKTVLADEQVINGACERCSSKVIKKELEQWFFRITEYAERLLKNLKKIDWSEKIKIAQRNWIGKSEGWEEYWKVRGMNLRLATFTTWPHTTWGATFMVIAPEHPIIEKLVKGTRYEAGARKFIERVKRQKIQDRTNPRKTKQGFFLGRYAINHLTGWKMPLYIANFAIMEYGTGIVKCTPAHDQRDFEFAKKYHLPIKVVVRPRGHQLNPAALREAFVEEGVMVNAGKFTGMPSERAREAIADFIVRNGNGKYVTHYRLRDWLISRQRYWGPPIPLIFCSNCKKLAESPKFQTPSSKFSKGELENPGWIAVPEKDLPVKLPYIKNFRPTGTEKSPLALVEKFYKVRCPKCKSWARRETDVSDTFLDSAWYYLGYLMVFENWKLKIENSAFSRIARKWLPVDMYIGGAEHAVLHLLYVRFLAMAFYDWKLIHFEEPFKRFRAHGLLIKDGAKMSKSRGNVVNPDDYIKAYGADALRMYLMFLGPFEQGGDFRDTGIKGITRFLERTWKLIFNFQFSIFNKNPKSKIQNPKFRTVGELDRVVHRTIKKVTNDIEGLQYNTAISALMVLLNAFEEEPSAVTKEHILFFLRLLAPFAPHITEELYQQFLGNPKSEIRNPKQIQNPKPKNQKTKFRSIHHEPWPKHDPKLLQEDTFELVVQVNGKVRDRIEIEAGASQAEVKEIALAREKVRQWLGRKPVRKFIYVPGRIVNIVVEAS